MANSLGLTIERLVNILTLAQIHNSADRELTNQESVDRMDIDRMEDLTIMWENTSNEILEKLTELTDADIVLLKNILNNQKRIISSGYRHETI